MRYWVYKDAQIVGPVDREQLASAVGLRADTLVCEEGSSGGGEMNWRCAEEFPELSGLYYSSIGAPPADFPVEEYGLLERLQFETAGTGEAEDWLGALFDAAPAAGLRPTPADIKLAQALEESEKRVAELTEQLSRLTKRLEELEKAPRAAMPQPALELPDAATLPPAAGPIEAPADSSLPQLPQKTSVSLPPAKSFAPKPKDQLPSIPSLAPSAEEPAPEPPAAPEPAPEPVDDNPNRLKLGLPQKKGVQLGAAKTFKTVKREAAAQDLPAAPAPLPAAPPPPPPPTPAEAAPPPLPALQPAPAPAAAPPPMTGWSTPAPATPMFAPQPEPIKPLEAPPIPSLAGATPPPADAPSPVALFTQAQARKATEPPPIPHTQPPSMQPPATLVGSAAGVAGQAGPATKEVLARLAKPQAAAEPAAAPAAPKPRSQKTFIVVGLAGILLVGVLGWLFLRNPEEVKTAVEMEPQRMGVETAQPETPAPQPMYQVQPPPEPAAPQAPEPVFDPSAAAIELVKGYPLDGDKGTIGQWLQFSYMSGQGTTERWDAGAVEETTFMVSYTVQPKGREAITYLFEADVTRGTVLGKNPLARELLAGGPPKPKASAQPAPARRRARAAKPKAREPQEPQAPKELPLLPLPSDTELLPPSEEAGSFNSDTIQGGL